MRKVLFLSLLLIAFTGLASADTISFSSMNNGTLSASGSSIPVEFWNAINDVSPVETLNFNIAGGTVDISNILSTTFGAGDVTSNNCDGVVSMCEVDLAGSASFALNPTFFASLGISGPNQFTLSGFIIGDTPVGGSYNVASWGLDAVQAPVPEPASILLLGSGLLLFAGSIRRKMNF